MNDETALVNVSLALIGSEQIISMDEDSTPAKKAKIFFTGIRDAVQRAHPWKCCLSRASLAAETDTPAFGYSYQYALPNNPYCLRALKLNEDYYTFTVEGRLLLTDYGDVSLHYISRVEDVASWDALLKQATAAALAAQLAFPIARSSKMMLDMRKYYNDVLKEARSINAMEGTPPVEQTDDWINARY